MSQAAQKAIRLSLLWAFVLTATAQAQPWKLTADDASSLNRFGDSVFLDGDRVIVGSDFDNHAGDRSGSSYILERNLNGTWSQVAKLTASDAASVDLFGSAVALSGDTAVVGAFGEGTGGAIYVFDRDEGGAGNWGEVLKVVDDATANADFGATVALDGDTAIVGAPGDDFPQDGSGSAYVFGRDEGGFNAWGRVAKLQSDVPGEGDHFGQSVSISGDTVLVGEPNGDQSGTTSGAVFVFERDEGGLGSWGQSGQLVPEDGGSFDKFGISVCVRGDIAVVGASGDLAGVGSTYVFERDQGGPGNWGQVAKLTADDGQSFDGFGRSVGVSGDITVVGTENAEAVYFFSRDEGGANQWNQSGKLTAFVSGPSPGPSFGWSVSISGERLIAGAPGADGAGVPNAGAAFVLRPIVPLFVDGFESGDVTAWSVVVP